MQIPQKKVTIITTKSIRKSRQRPVQMCNKYYIEKHQKLHRILYRNSLRKIASKCVKMRRKASKCVEMRRKASKKSKYVKKRRNESKCAKNCVVMCRKASKCIHSLKYINHGTRSTVHRLKI